MKQLKLIVTTGALALLWAQNFPSTYGAQRDNSVPPPASADAADEELMEPAEEPAEESTDDPNVPPEPQPDDPQQEPLPPEEPAPLEPVPGDEAVPEPPAPEEQPAADPPMDENPPTVPAEIEPNGTSLEPTAPVKAGAEPIEAPPHAGAYHGGPAASYGGDGMLPGRDWRRRPTGGNCGWWAGECDDCCPPSCYVEGGVLFYQRHRSDEFRLIENQNAAGPRGQRPTLLTTDVFDDNAEGEYVAIGHICDPCYRVELKYMGLFDIEDSVSMRSTTVPTNLSFPFDTQIDSNFDGFERLRSSYESDLHSLEANLFYTPCGCCCITPLVGFRYLRLDEHLGLAAIETNGDVGRYIINADNDLIGFQIGAVIDRPLGKCWSWNVFGKAGAYGNFAEQETTLRAEDDTIEYRDSSDDEDDFAFVGEVGINVVGHIAPRMAIIAGYSAMWLDGVALAPEQLDFTTTPTSGARVNVDGDVLYHGWNLGVRFYF